MSLQVPLTVRLRTSRSDKHITRDVSDLVFREVDPGGYSSASFSIDRALARDYDEIALYGDADIIDTRNGECVWCGRTEDPGKGAGSDGETWELAATGPSAHVYDRTVPLIYVDRSLEGWVRLRNGSLPDGSGSAYGQVSNDPTNDQLKALVMGWNKSVVLSTSAQVNMQYYRMRQTGQKLARFDYNWDAARTDTQFEIRSYSLTDGGSAVLQGQETFNTAGGSPVARVVGTHFTNGANEWRFTVIYTAAGGTTASDAYWVSVLEGDLYTVAMRYNADGTEKTTGYTTSTVLASEVVADLLGRLLTKFDGANATIDTTTFPIEHLAYIDPVNPGKILNDLMLLEPAFTWRAGNRNREGKYAFDWVSRPTTVRYEASITDSYRSTGSADGLYNGITVRWRGPSGWVHHTRRTSTVPELDNAELTRDAFVDLGDEVSSEASAEQVGDQFLDDHRYPANEGTLIVAGKQILDRYTNRMVWPWEIKAGYLIRVRGIKPRPNALNTSTRDGVSVFRIKSKEFRASTVTSALELDSYPPDVERAVAQLQQHQITRRR